MFDIRHLCLHVSINICTVNKDSHKSQQKKKNVDYVKKVILFKHVIIDSTILLIRLEALA